MRWITDRPLSKEETLEWIDVNIQYYAYYGYGIYRIILKESAESIGFCGFLPPEKNPYVELVIALDIPYWDDGLGTEIAKAVTGVAFDELGINQFVARVHPMDFKFRRVVEKIGMKLRFTRTDTATEKPGVAHYHKKKPLSKRIEKIISSWMVFG
jgi:RimJ/RimL family protein N-acetyltransferase